MNKKGSMWGMIVKIISVGLVLLIIFTITSDVRDGSSDLGLTASCLNADYDGDGFSNTIEQANSKLAVIKNRDSACPCDLPADSSNVVLNPKIWDSDDKTGPYVIFDYTKKDELKKIITMPERDVDFMLWFFTNKDFTSEKDSLPETYRTNYFEGSISEYLKDGVNLKTDLTLEFFCPKNCKDSSDTNCCNTLLLKTEWFAEGKDSTTTKMNLEYVCATSIKECTPLLKQRCIDEKVAEESGKV